MKTYLSLIPIYAGAHRRQNRMTRICIILAVFLVTSIFSMADMEIRSQYLQIENTDGAWHVSFQSITDEQAALISTRPDVSETCHYGVLNYRLDEDFSISGNQVVICGVDETFSSMYPVAALSEGSFPKKGEIVLTDLAKALFGVLAGDTVEMSLPDGGSQSFVVAGFSEGTAMLAQADAVGVIMNIDEFHALCQEAGIPQPGETFFVRFTDVSDVQETTAGICRELKLPDDSAQENVKLLGVMGKSGDSYMIKLYATAAVLAVLVVIAGVLMISSSLNVSISRRTEFFGLLRCLGASKAQVRRYVHMEALSWCAATIPLGIGCSVITTWICCWVLRKLSPGYFASMPTFGISLIAIASGIVLGIATVLLAARSPAGRASRVSPLVAMNGNDIQPTASRHGVRLRGASVDSALGMSHAMHSKRNLLLMTASFAFSIVLFLSFSTSIDFMNHAIRPLQPYTPDISVVSSDNTCSISEISFNEIQSIDTVKRAYGRMFAYDVPARAGNKDVRINLISYERHQFEWAEDSLISGSLEAVENGRSVLVVYSEGSELKNGDLITGDFGSGINTVNIGGMLSDSPFSRESGIETVICSEETFRMLTGQSAYTIIDVQLTSKATDQDIADIRAAGGSNTDFSDQRLNNREIRAAFYSMSVFLYGFLLIIALIAVFNIINSMGLSVSARTKQYGAMRAIGMSDRQLYRMILSEAMTYAAFGVFFGCVLGLPLNKILFDMMVTSYWGDTWSLPWAALLVIISAVGLSAVFSVRGPFRRICSMSIISTIHSD